MKLTKIAGAVALTAALAMSAVPAFAAVDATNVENFKVSNTDPNTSEATTEVYYELLNSDLNASIPTRVCVAIPTTGGRITAPDSSAYVIKNNGTNTKGLKITKISSMPGALAFSDSEGAVKNSKDSIYVTLKLGTNTPLQLKGNTTNFAIQGDRTLIGATDNSTLTIAPGGKMELGLYGNVALANSKKPLSAANLTSSLLSITYTIAIGDDVTGS